MNENFNTTMSFSYVPVNAENHLQPNKERENTIFTGIIYQLFVLLEKIYSGPKNKT